MRLRSGRRFVSGADGDFFPVLSFYALFLFGPFFCPLAGALGGGIGILVARTGRSAEAVVSQEAPHA